MLCQLKRNAFKQFYDLYIHQIREKRNNAWDYYVIHYYLDNTLFGNGRGRYQKAHFDCIFFNSNIFELKRYFEYHINRASHLSIANIQAFLRRQRDTNVRRALAISLEENEVNNRRKDLLVYDPEAGVVQFDDISQELLDHYHETVINVFGLIKQDGCPFAKTKGIEKNAVIEVFEYFDNMMVYVLRNSSEFSQLFGYKRMQANHDYRRPA